MPARDLAPSRAWRGDRSEAESGSRFAAQLTSTFPGGARDRVLAARRPQDALRRTPTRLSASTPVRTGVPARAGVALEYGDYGEQLSLYGLCQNVRV